MTRLTKAVWRISRRTRYEGGKDRAILCGMEPGDLLSFRLAGTRATYTISIESAYAYAVKQTNASESKGREYAREVRRGVL